MPPKVTLKDVAAAAGVTAMTVSRALRDSSEVKPGDRVTVTLARGELDCDVRNTR